MEIHADWSFYNWPEDHERILRMFEIKYDQLEKPGPYYNRAIIGKDDVPVYMSLIETGDLYIVPAPAQPKPSRPPVPASAR
jgi:hypothetical protein